jgi:hypothetical protein
MSQLVDKRKGNIQTAWIFHMPIFYFRNVKQANRNEIAYYHIVIPVNELFSAISPRSIMPFSLDIPVHQAQLMCNYLISMD